MKQARLLMAVVLLTAFFAESIFAQKQNFPTKPKDGQSEMIDTRVDAMKYWRQLAEEGIIPVQQRVPIAPAEFTGSMITAKSVMGGKDDSPDVPLTTATNVSESENSIFVDPNNTDNVLNSNNSTSWNGGSVGTLYGANYFISNDAGATWGGSAQGAGGGNSGDPTTAISLSGRMYVNYISNSYGQGIAWSDNGGSTWSTASVAPNPGSLADKNHMWIDNSPTSPYEGNLYVAWTPFGGGNDSEIVMNRSTNEGVSWSSSLNISSAVNAGSHNQGVNVQTGPNGEVYACWTIYDSWPSDESALGFAKSTDGGATYSPAVRIIDNIRGIRTTETSKNHRVNSFPAMAVDISTSQYSGNIYVVWANIGVPGVNTGNDIDVYMISSEDEGATWSSPVRVNQDPTGQGKEHYFPWITCDPESGILSAIFYDDRNVNSNQCEVYCANSFDAGATWEDFKVSDVSFTPSPIPGLAGGYMGDYLGIIARGSVVYPVWTDNRSGIFMAYTSPFVTNNLPKPTDLVINLDDATGDIDLEWQFASKDDFLYFIVYRDGVELGTTTDLTYTDILPDYGIFSYAVTAMHDDGESVAASGSIQWGDAHIDITPDALNVNLLVGTSTVEPIMIENVGELELHYTLSPEITSDKGVDSYCDASGGCDEYIAQVILGDINNSSSCDGYGDYTNMSTLLNVGETYDITVVNGNVWSADDLGVWIDWNQDDDFEDAGENVVCEIDNGGEGTFSFDVPETAVPGETTMRVRIKYSGSDCGSPCGATTYGEVEDYTIQILGWLLVDKTEDTIQPGQFGGVSVTLDAADLVAGIYTANLNFSSNDPDNPMITVPVTLAVGDDIPTVVATASPDEVCQGESTQLMATPEGGSGTYTYEWYSIPDGFTSTEQNPMVTPDDTTTYIVEVFDGIFTVADTIAVNVKPFPGMAATPEGEVMFCIDPGSIDYTTLGAVDATTYMWSLSPVEAGTITGDGMTVTIDWSAEFTGDAMINVTGVNDCGDGQVSEDLMVSIYALPDVSLNEADSVCVYNEAFELTTGQPTGGTYEGTGVYEDGGMYYFNPEQAGLGEHTLSYTYLDMNGCENFAEETIYVGECLGIGETARSLNLKIFPNPNNGSFVIKLDAIEEGRFDMKVMNNIGMVIYAENDLLISGSWEKELDLSDLSQGIYFINIYNDDTNILRKLVIRK
ncbi:MAG: T9SS type A sorting domain-containing protein [Bacteroidales bacterium]|nr:T9SS type A sorting domain-containing protein [Bacteroidales bacterium]